MRRISANCGPRLSEVSVAEAPAFPVVADEVAAAVWLLLAVADGALGATGVVGVFRGTGDGAEVGETDAAVLGAGTWLCSSQNAGVSSGDAVVVFAPEAETAVLVLV